jgi:D-tagatose-1,6-bisphosphate aldolase subunit GatZ/KbaZ
MSVLRAVVDANRAGEQHGIPSICSAHPLVLEACIDQAVSDDRPLLVEATCNQVNQEGGYTGMRAADFRAFVTGLAAERGLPAERLILGGDHLGPNPWRREPAETAMAKAEALVRSYAAAGFRKLHLDASMACAGDPEPLPTELIARRAARLCRAAETEGARPAYVIGTEVPVPGGAHEAIDRLEVTRTTDLARTIEVHQAAFADAGLDGVWPRVLAVVVQPGVEFGSAQVVDFVPERALELAAFIETVPGLAFEAHSTDYQIEAALRALVAHHFAILKVGPGLTFALREALFALAAIEAEWIPAEDRSRLREALEAAMLADPSHWRGHHEGSAEEQRLARAFSLSDRCRYYWPVPAVAAAVDRLLGNLTARPAPLPLLSQYLPRQHDAIRVGALDPDPRALVRAKVREIAAVYARACGAGQTGATTTSSNA